MGRRIVGAAVALLLLSPMALAEGSFPPAEAEIVSVERAPHSISDLYQRHRSALIEDLGDQFKELNEDGLAAVFSMLVAHQVAPLGPSENKFTLRELLDEPVLDCDAYALLAARFFAILRPESSAKIRMVGWNGGVIGNHAQLLTEGTGMPLLLDPTVGLAAVATFDQILQGDAVDTIRTWTVREETADLAGFRKTVVEALEKGRYKPSDLLYFVGSALSWPEVLQMRAGWATPQNYLRYGK